MDAAGPEDDWYYENGVWFEEEEEGDERSPKLEADAYEIVSKPTVARLDGRPVLVTGGGRFGLSHPDEHENVEPKTLR
ncbi:hypothetical protein ACIBLA_23730 [Streptomyces sp. NPDC050433]|uniref:hypothetical protein n=1 Tax=Streptomyces sp. NPDC050433 TaxID=3365615 RepID=UPI0037BDE7D6